MRKARQPRVRSDIGPIPAKSGDCMTGQHWWCGEGWRSPYTDTVYICDCTCHRSDQHVEEEDDE